VALSWREIDRILEELDLEGCFVRQIHQPTHTSLVLELFCGRGPRRVLISLANPHCRIHRLTRSLPNPKRPQRFASFLRARIRGGRILRAYQVRGQRVVRLSIQRGEQVLDLWVRLWTSAANVIVTDESHTILDAHYRRPRRDEVSGGHYDPETEFADSSPDPGFEAREFQGEGDYNSRVEATFFALEDEAELERLRKQLEKDLDQREGALRARIRKLNVEERKRGDFERWKQLGDLITSSLHRINPGSEELEVEDYYNEGQRVAIALDPQLTPAENARHYYEAYQKARGAATRAREELDGCRKALEHIEEQRLQLAGEKSLPVLRALRSEAPVSRQKQLELPGLQFRSNQHRIFVGRTSRENDLLLRRHVAGNDYWFHARDWPGAYVFVKTIKGKSVPLETMLDAGTLAVFYSKGRASGAGDIYYTQVKFLRRAREGKTGLVIPTREKNLFVRLDLERVEKLRKSQVG
jgi:predicted ribosome quality control (RQC) complex YloA/Tae2 family protein